MPASWTYLLVPPAGVVADPSTPPLEMLAIKDYLLNETGDRVLPIQLVSGADAIVQMLRLRFRFSLGAWFRDTRLGIPYIDQVFVVAPYLPFIEALFRRVILSTPGVASIKTFRMSADLRARRFSIEEFEAVCVDGSTLVLTNTPFIVSE